jgi:O-antigen/teichoic acid export membrane protein
MAAYAMSYSVLLAKKEFNRAALVQFLWVFLRSFVVFVFLMVWRDVTPLFWGIVVAALLGLVPVKMTAPRIEKEVSTIDKKHVLVLAFLLLVSAIALRGIFQVDKIFIKNILNDDNIVGIYSLASNFSLILQFFAFALIATLFPTLSGSYAESDLDLTRKYLFTCTRYSLLVLIPLAFTLSVVSKDVILLMFGEQYISSVRPFTVLIFSSAIFSLFMIYRQLLVSVNRHWMNVFITVLVFIAALVLNPFFIRKYGFMGAAWATFSCSAGGAVFSCVYIFKLLKQRFPWLSLARILAGSLVCFWLAVLCSHLVAPIRYGVYAVLAVGFVGVLVLLGEITREDWITVKSIFSGFGKNPVD